MRSKLHWLAIPCLVMGCSDSDPDASLGPRWALPENPALPAAPEPPALMRDVSLVSDDIEFTRPYVPGHRTTMDGRVAMRVQGGPPGTERIRRSFSFFLFVPERLEGPILPGEPGAQILRDAEPFEVPFPLAQGPEVERFGHHAICDATTEFPAPGERPNPYACGPQLAHDCYDLTLVTSVAVDFNAQVYGVPVTIEVEAPKTVDAKIIRADLGEPVKGPYIPFINELLEPAVTRDGKLLTARLGRTPRDWTHPDTGETIQRFYDLVYFPPAEGMSPCDVTAWTQFHPMSHAPYDPVMIGRYGIADYPFRDSEGALIPDGEDLGGTYPWVDREGANVFMTAIPGRMVEQPEDQYPRRCVVDGCEDFRENTDWDRGFLVGGLWTHGKLVLLVAMINHLDWAIGVTPEAHYYVDLYRDPAGDPVTVRLGAGRYIDAVRNRGGPYPGGYTHNANILDSLQNLLNQHPHAQPITPRDVVWIMSNGVATDEIAFDDFLDPDAFIVSNMQASVTQFIGEAGDYLAVPRYWNGQLRELEFPIAVAELNVLRPEAQTEIHVQNGATSLNWNLPSYGRVEAGEGRIEPAALGGIKGKGFWLSGANHITYAIPAQPRDVRSVDWTFGIFVDPADDARRLLATFPDGSRIELAGRSRVSYVTADRLVHEVALPAPSADWLHLGWRVSAGNTLVELLLDGFPFDRFESPRPLFELSEGELVLGHRGAHAGFRGWIDDLKILAHDVNPEVACNHAHGTLIQVDASPEWRTLADRYPAWSHDGLAANLGESSDARFACFHDYRVDYGAHLRNIPEGTRGLRERLIFPEGPLRAGAPRPDSSQNAFCLSCHHSAGKGGLSIEALTLAPGLMLEDDPRRQPLQPPRRVFGNIPAHWLTGSPDEALVAPDEGLLIDRWVLEPVD